MNESTGQVKPIVGRIYQTGQRLFAFLIRNGRKTVGLIGRHCRSFGFGLMTTSVKVVRRASTRKARPMAMRQPMLCLAKLGREMVEPQSKQRTVVSRMNKMIDR